MALLAIFATIDFSPGEQGGYFCRVVTHLCRSCRIVASISPEELAAFFTEFTKHKVFRGSLLNWTYEGEILQLWSLKFFVF